MVYRTLPAPRYERFAAAHPNKASRRRQRVENSLFCIRQGIIGVDGKETSRRAQFEIAGEAFQVEVGAEKDIEQAHIFFRGCESEIDSEW